MIITPLIIDDDQDQDEVFMIVRPSSDHHRWWSHHLKIFWNWNAITLQLRNPPRTPPPNHFNLGGDEQSKTHDELELRATGWKRFGGGVRGGFHSCKAMVPWCYHKNKIDASIINFEKSQSGDFDKNGAKVEFAIFISILIAPYGISKKNAYRGVRNPKVPITPTHVFHWHFSLHVFSSFWRLSFRKGFYGVRSVSQKTTCWLRQIPKVPTLRRHSPKWKMCWICYTYDDFGRLL